MRGPRSTSTEAVAEFVAGGGQWCARQQSYFQVNDRGQVIQGGACRVCREWSRAQRSATSDRSRNRPASSSPIP